MESYQTLSESVLVRKTMAYQWRELWLDKRFYRLSLELRFLCFVFAFRRDFQLKYPNSQS